MKIVRDNKEFELTEKEMQQAYRELRHQWDMEDMTGWVLLSLDEDDSGKYDSIIERLKNDKDFLDRAAFKYRDFLDDIIDDIITGEDELDCWINACNYIINCEKYEKE